MTNLKGKVVVITGASRGIGAASAKLLAADKPKLILCAQTSDASYETKVASEALGAKVETYGFDISDARASKNFVDTVIQLHGRIDVLINNAGSGKMGSVAAMPPDVFQEVHKINVMGPYNMIHALLPSMIESDCGTIINLTSARAFIPGRYYAAYCSSKAALISMTQCLNIDLQGTKIKIYAFSPGFTDTDMVREMYSNKDFQASALTNTSGQSPERPAKVLSWLARNAPDDLVGQHVQIQFNDISLRAGLEN
ncbi:MAG: SDR family NAD(P)-dependent oxidoreductase [Alphaproteobacteria bacterium]|nr:SDR family NAD(P)-dependent oxidoreductase [Alphaproteobacteria bacterium]|tara:strand:+ start:112 stop:873 length:762 start_codon:yes stop_codon:yes gene_type:complete